MGASAVKVKCTQPFGASKSVQKIAVASNARLERISIKRSLSNAVTCPMLLNRVCR